jgi:putative nucleotidyltransferase with HDIG domain
MKQGVINPQILKSEIEQLDKLYSSPVVASEVLKYLESDDISVTHLAHLISTDAVLVARVMKLANSENYGFRSQISTLNLAIITIGFSSLVDLLRGIAAVDQFHDQSNRHVQRLMKLWLHSATVGLGAKSFSQMIGYPVSGEAMVAGLLHDIGYQVLNQLYPDHLAEVFDVSNRLSISSPELEKKQIGVDHGQIGAWLAKSWNFPEKLVTAIQYHHTPDKTKQYSDLVQLTYYANILSHSYDFYPESDEDGLAEINRKFEKTFRLNGRSYEQYRELFKPLYPNFNQFIKSKDFILNYN